MSIHKFSGEEGARSLSHSSSSHSSSDDSQLEFLRALRVAAQNDDVASLPSGRREKISTAELNQAQFGIEILMQYGLQLKELKERVKKCEEGLEKGSQQIARQEKKIEDTDKEIVQLKQESKELKEKLKEKSGDHDRIKALEEQVAKLIEEKVKEKAAEKEQMAKLIANDASRKEQIAKLNTEMASTLEKQASLTNSFAELNNFLNDLHQAVEIIQQDAQDTKKETEVHKTLLTLLSNAIKTFNLVAVQPQLQAQRREQQHQELCTNAPKPIRLFYTKIYNELFGFMFKQWVHGYADVQLNPNIKQKMIAHFERWGGAVAEDTMPTGGASAHALMEEAAEVAIDKIDKKREKKAKNIAETCNAETLPEEIITFAQETTDKMKALLMSEKDAKKHAKSLLKNYTSCIKKYQCFPKNVLVQETEQHVKRHSALQV